MDAFSYFPTQTCYLRNSLLISPRFLYKFPCTLSSMYFLCLLHNFFLEFLREHLFVLLQEILSIHARISQAISAGIPPEIAPDINPELLRYSSVDFFEDCDRDAFRNRSMNLSGSSFSVNVTANHDE